VDAADRQVSAAAEIDGHAAGAPAIALRGTWSVETTPPGWLAGARASWNALLARSDADPVFSSWEWIASASDTLGGARGAHIVAVRRAGELVALMPLFRVRSRASLGMTAWSLALAERTGADYADVVCARSAEAGVAEALARWLLRERGWARIAITDVRPDSVARAVARRMSAEAAVDDAPGNACPRIALDAGFDAWLRDRFTRKHRYNVKRQLRQAEDGGLRLVVHDGPDAFGRGYPVLAALHLERKRAQRVVSTFAEGAAAGFHRLAARRLASAGSMQVAILESNGVPLAAASALRGRDALYYFQTGVSQAGLEAGAGTTLLLMLVRRAATDGVRAVDMLKGDEPYKATFATGVVQQRTVAITPRNAIGAAQRLAARAYRRLAHGVDRRRLGLP
jgi:CelD/BcsL family acetyltransferase involved in cellulose biosynthesis